MDKVPLWQNPLLVKHLRSRLRPQQLIPSVLGVVLVAVCISWWGTVDQTMRQGGAFIAMLVLQGFIVFLAGSSSVAASVAYARENGLLDFHRISPQTPTALALGFVLGGPIREWVLFACTLPFSLYCAVRIPNPAQWPLVVVATVVAALLYHTLAALAGVVTTRARDAGSVAVLLPALAHVACMSKAGFLTAVPLAAVALTKPEQWQETVSPWSGLLGIALPPMVPTLLHMLPAMAFVFIALTRRLRHDAAPAYSKPQAVLFHVVIGLIVFADLWSPSAAASQDALTLGVLAAATLSGLLLSAAVTPGAGQFANGLRRARKMGLLQAPPWSDLAPNWAPLFSMAAIVVGLGAAAAVLSGSDSVTPWDNAAAIATAACALLGCSAAKQFFDLRYGKAGKWYFGLFIFLLWVMPLPVAALLTLSGVEGEAALTLLGLSPLPAIALISAGEQGLSPAALPAVAVLASTITAILFIVLGANVERKAKG